MNFQVKEIAERVKALREILDIPVEEVAKATEVTKEQYLMYESGDADMSIAFIYNCAKCFGVEVTDILRGNSPTLSSFTITRAGKGLTTKRSDFDYTHLAPFFKNKKVEPFLVTARYNEEEQNRPIHLNYHSGQEVDIIKSGYLKMQVGDHVEIACAGDVLYYDSSTPHGMIATGGVDCEFYAIVIDGEDEKRKYIDSRTMSIITHDKAAEYEATPAEKQEEGARLGVADKFVTTTVDGDGIFNSIKFHDIDRFNFAYDILDEIARIAPEKLAMLHIDKDKTERRFTFKDISRESNRAANYFRSVGITRGDRVMLVLKRHYQFWIAMMGLNKLGAVAIPATNQLLAKDLDYRFNAAGISAVIVTPDDGVPDQVEIALATSPTVKHKLIVGGPREEWRDFDAELPMYSSHFERVDVGGDDTLLMYFTSGTTGYPKIAVHNHKYPLGHYPTARYWHCVDPRGLHLTISDTGWAKAMWGKLYGQWMAEGALFVYNFDRFDAADILPMFAKYGITTFCAPPTMYRFMIKEDLSKYDLSSVKHATIAGEALNAEVYEQFKRHTGLSLMEAFGQTETTVVLGNFDGMKPKPGSMGKPSPLYNVKLLDSDGKDVAPGETGEICINTQYGNPCGLFCGYYNNEESTKAAWHDGFYHTGDTAWRDEEGYYHYVGRVDDLIKSSGYRIGPFEIESVIMELPYVLEVAVTAVPHEIRGQVVKANIVLTKGTDGTEELKKEIQNYVKSRTAPYKYPRVVEFMDSLPKTASGKIKRNELREQG